MRHTPDIDDVRREIDRRVNEKLVKVLRFLNACAQGNADGNASFRDLAHVAECIETGRWSP